MACKDCHERGYERHPHHGPRALPRFFCVDCHAEDERVRALKFAERKRDVLESAHGRGTERPLECHDCHDPHRFRLVSGDRPLRDQIQDSNALCLDCHGQGDGRRRFPGLSPAPPKHHTIPNARDHMRKLKCVACHASLVDGRTHAVRPAEEAQRQCTKACHGDRAQILRSLYGEPEGPSLGGARRDPVARDAYVIGATRTPRLDRLSQLGFLFLLGTILAHVTARIVAARRRRQRDAGH